VIPCELVAGGAKESDIGLMSLNLFLSWGYCNEWKIGIVSDGMSAASP